MKLAHILLELIAFTLDQILQFLQLHNLISLQVDHNSYRAVSLENKITALI